jgi:hypothetical protein
MVEPAGDCCAAGLKMQPQPVGLTSATKPVSAAVPCVTPVPPAPA